MNTEAKRAISERFKAACEREGLNYSEAARLLGLKNSVYGPHISNEKSFNKASNEAWETVKAWTNSGESLRKYGAKQGNKEKPESELSKSVKTKSVKSENDKPLVWHTINDNPDIPEWAKQQALRDIEQMQGKVKFNKSTSIARAFFWIYSNSGSNFLSAISDGDYDSIPAPEKWLIPEDMIPDRFKEGKEIVPERPDQKPDQFKEREWKQVGEFDQSNIIPEDENTSDINGNIEIQSQARPYCCPVCAGNGLVPNGFYRQVGGIWSSTDATPEKCRACKGTGIVWG